MTRVHPASWLTTRRVRIHGILLAVGIWTAYAANMNTPGLLDRNGLIKGTDFLHFYTLGTLAREGRGGLLYNVPVQTALLHQLVPEAKNYVYVPLYGPQVSLLFSPFSRLPYSSALLVWLGLNVLIYGACCFAVWKCCPSLANRGWMVLLLAIAFPGISQLLAWGQTSGLALMLFTLAFLALQSKQNFLAGLAIGCLIFKPQLGLAAAVVFVFLQQWKVVGGAVLSALAQIGVGWLRFGMPVMRDYIRALAHVNEVSAQLEPRPYQTHSLRSFWTMVIPWPEVALALYLASAIVVFALLVRCWRRESNLAVKFSALLLATVLVSPHLTVYDLVVLAPAFLLLGDWALAHAEESLSGQVQMLLYLCFPLFLLGPVVRYIHVQLSVIAMAALLLIASRLFSSHPAAIPHAPTVVA